MAEGHGIVCDEVWTAICQSVVVKKCLRLVAQKIQAVGILLEEEMLERRFIRQEVASFVHIQNRVEH